MEVRILSWTDDKPIRRCSLHHSRSQMTMVMAMTITVDNLLPRPKLDCNRGYDTAMKGPSVVVSRIRDGFQLELDWTSAITWMTWTPTLVPFVSMSCFDGVMSSSTSPLLLPLGWRSSSSRTTSLLLHELAKVVQKELFLHLLHLACHSIIITWFYLLALALGGCSL